MLHYLFRISLVVFLLLSSIVVNGEDNKTTDEISVAILVPKNKERPRMPSGIFIECRYSVSHISFVLPSDISFLDVSITKNDILIWEGVVTNLRPEAIIPILSIGEYSIICQTNENQIFQGLLKY